MEISFSVQGLVLFLFFLTPGFVYSRSYFTALPRYYRQSSLLEEAAVAFAASLAIHAVLLAAMALALLVASGLLQMRGHASTFLSIKDTAARLSEAPLPDLSWPVLIVVTYLVVGIVAAHYAGLSIGRRSHASVPLWYVALVEEPHTVPVWVTAHLKTGQEYTGALSRIVWTGDKENTVEMGLEKAVLFERSSDPEGEDRVVPVEDRMLLLSSSDVLWIARFGSSEQTTTFS